MINKNITSSRKEKNRNVADIFKQKNVKTIFSVRVSGKRQIYRYL